MLPRVVYYFTEMSRRSMRFLMASHRMLRANRVNKVLFFLLMILIPKKI
jgi:hypothetical protein